MSAMSTLVSIAGLAGCRTDARAAPDDAGAATAARAPAASMSARAAMAKEAAWAPPSPVPPELTGPLTIERVALAKSILTAPKSEPKVYPLLLAQLGKPTKVTTGTHAVLGKEQKHYLWAAKSGTTCASYFVVQQPNTLPDWPANLVEDLGDGTFVMPKTLPTIGSPDSVELRDAWEAYARCTRVLGEEPGLPADAPGAAGPGPLSTKSDITTGIVRAPSKWLGKPVTVEGVVTGGQRLSIATAKGTVDCRKLSREPGGAALHPGDDAGDHRLLDAEPRVVHLCLADIDAPVRELRRVSRNSETSDLSLAGRPWSLPLRYGG